MARHGLEVVGPVQPGGPVHGSACSLHERHVLGLGDVARALEHDVLEQVGKAGLALDLVLRADVVPDAYRHDRGQMVLRDDDSKSVRQTLIREPDGWGGHAVEVPPMARGGAGVSARPAWRHCSRRAASRRAPKPGCGLDFHRRGVSLLSNTC